MHTAQQTVSESTTCDETTSTTPFVVPFFTVIKKEKKKQCGPLFSTRGKFLTVRDPYSEKFKNIS